MPKPSKIVTREVPAKYKETLSNWFLLFKKWKAFNYVIGVAGIVCPIIAAIPAIQKIGISIAFACVASMASGFLAFFKPAQREKGYGDAWTLLKYECDLYEVQPDYQLKNLVEAENAANKLIP